MTLYSGRTRNHPQQVAKRGAIDAIDDRGTSPELFLVLNERFQFTVDVAASDENAKLPRYYTIADDGLAKSWAGERVWCNPPFSSIGKWVDKAWLEWGWPVRPECIVMLLPANRTEQPWWQRSVEPFRDRGGSPLRTEFLASRHRFITPQSFIDLFGRPRGGENRAPFGCVLLVWEDAHE